MNVLFIFQNKLKICTALSLLFLFSYLTCQTAPNKYLIKFTDKNNSPFSINNPSEYLSERAITRRVKYDISISTNDLPVNPTYIENLNSLGVEILTTSKWMNSATIYSTDTALIDTLPNLSYIQSVNKSRILYIDTNSISSNNVNYKLNSTNDYGFGWWQIQMLNGNYLHDNGYKGEDMIIAVLDAGFYKADELPAFDSAWANNQIIGYKDFVDESKSVFSTSHHGMKVLSTMIGNVPGKFIGTAPCAKYLLLRSEDTSSEYIIEEDNWIAAAEFADSAGADLINSSLGYTDFDDTSQNHSYSDLDGNTTRVSIAADIAASKGILVVTSAGNEGAKIWKYITAPADADSVLTVGAVDSTRNYASFSSIGPSSDGRVKPDIATQGKDAYFQWVSEAFGPGNGTSFASPIACGLVACLWQANPNASNMEIIEAVKKSSHQYYAPDEKLGYGIPNFKIADLILKDKINTNNDSLTVFPNPFNDLISVEIFAQNDEDINIKIFNSLGRQVYVKNTTLGNGYVNCLNIDDLQHLSTGVYVLKLQYGNKSNQVKIFKE